MEAKIILGLINDDIAHLEGITSGFGLDPMPTATEVELAVIRAKALLAELELFHKFTDRDQQLTNRVQVKENSDVLPVQQTFPAKESMVPINDIPPETKVKLDETMVKPDEADKKKEHALEKVDDVQAATDITIDKPHQSVNELHLHKKHNVAYENIPIKSLREAIGINDRFLFTRELFDNNSSNFETTVAALDGQQSIQEAVDYLKLNFKWGNTEASQKFLAFVKRRFTK